MNKYLQQFDKWYHHRSTREQLFLMLLGCVFIYLVSYFTLFRAINFKEALLIAKIDFQNKEIQSINNKIISLKNISTSPVYKKWIAQQNNVKLIHQKFRDHMLTVTPDYWQNIIKTVLLTQQNITTDAIKYYPDAVFNIYKVNNKEKKIYAQKVELTIQGTYFNVISYLKSLEKALPLAQWNKLDYRVNQYPNAIVAIEFSILYEPKNEKTT